MASARPPVTPSTRASPFCGIWRDLLKTLDRLLTQKASAIRMYAWPTVMVTGGPYSIDQARAEWTREIEIEPGGVLQLLPGEVVQFLSWPGAGPDIDRQITTILQMLQQVGISDPAMGVGAGQSGYAMSQLIQATRMKFAPIQQHGEAAFEDQIQLLLDIVENVMPHPIYLYPDGERNLYRMGPSEIKGQRQVRVNLTPTMPSDRYANSSRVIAEYTSGLVSRRHGMEELGVDDPQAMELEILWDEIKRRPPILQIMEDMVKQSMGLEMLEQQGGPEQAMGARSRRCKR